MRREADFNDISDGRLYQANDMVKADCHDCKGCSSCCRGMGQSIVLTPYDVYLMTTGLNTSFEQLLAGKVELNVYDGVILPSLAMAGPEERCSFLNEEGRCSIHAFRPGICRLFPLGRIYREDGFDYFLQTGECKNNNRTKIKISKWLDTPQLAKNEKFVFRWHEFIKDIENQVAGAGDENRVKMLNMKMLNIFFIAPYTKDDFYEQIEARFNQWFD